MTEPLWWRNAVTYQIYPRSFLDGNGDGIGDIAGMRDRLPYLKRLGVDAVWVSPWYRSPFNDGGYDVADYRAIDARFGTTEDAEDLIDEAHGLGIKFVVDLVPNHTSSEHKWFQEVLASAPGDACRDRYIVRPGRGDDGEQPPTNWTSVFGGSAWSRMDDGEWYLHLFETTQPDLNWLHPEVGDEFESILRFWLDRGVDGFRVDVAHGLMKDQTFPDSEAATQILGATKSGQHPHWDRDEVHAVYRRWRGVLNEYGDDRMMVAEAWVEPSRLPMYVRPDEFHQSFDFDLLQADWSAEGMRSVITHSVAAAAEVGSAPTWVLSNHDVVRHATRYGLPAETNWRGWVLNGPHGILDQDLGQRRARAAALLLLALPGAAYVYQGDELGLDEVWDLPEEALEDPVWEMTGHRVKGRDGCRVPLPWVADAPNFGFGGNPWLPQPASFVNRAADQQDGADDSMLELYRAALSLRASHFCADESLTIDDAGSDVISFVRGNGARCIVNFGSAAVPFTGDLLLSSIPMTKNEVPTDAAVWIAPPAHSMPE